jgi:hypothetical protein
VQGIDPLLFWLSGMHEERSFPRPTLFQSLLHTYASGCENRQAFHHEQSYVERRKLQNEAGIDAKQDWAPNETVLPTLRLLCIVRDNLFLRKVLLTVKASVNDTPTRCSRLLSSRIARAIAVAASVASDLGAGSMIRVSFLTLQKTASNLVGHCQSLVRFQY